MNIFEMSLQASAMIAVIIIVRALGVNRVPKWGFQILWGVAVARLLLPLRVEFHLSAYNAIRQFGRTLPSAPPVAFAPANAGLTTPMTAEPARAAFSAGAAIPGLSPWLALWLAGAVLIFTYFVMAHIRGRKVYSKARPMSGGPVSARFWTRKISIRISARIDAPLTYGVLHPVILMPESLRTGEHFDCALAHELIHVRHWDALKKWVLALTVCVHWFNPLVWAMYVLVNRDIELYCDDSLLRAQGGGRKARYASMLIDLEEARSIPTPLVSHFGRNAIEERIGAIMKHKKTSALGAILTIALVIFTTAALATSAAPQAADLPATSLSQKAAPTPTPAEQDGDEDGWLPATGPQILPEDVDPTTYLKSNPNGDARLYQYVVAPALPDRETTVASFFGEKAPALEENDASQGNYLQKYSNDNACWLMWNEVIGAFSLHKFSRIPLEYRQADEAIDGFNEKWATPSPQEGKYTQAEAAQIAMDFLCRNFGIDPNILKLVYVGAESPRKDRSRAYTLRFGYIFDGVALTANALDAESYPYIKISVTDDGVVSVDGTALKIVERQDYDGRRIMDIDEVKKRNNLTGDPHTGEAELVYWLEQTGDGMYRSLPIWCVYSILPSDGKAWPLSFYSETGKEAIEYIE